ncbi:MAG: arsenic resistance N-acetyltransferase ArsN2 [Casimicrobiaceae bacterium]
MTFGIETEDATRSGADWSIRPATAADVARVVTLLEHDRLGVDGVAAHLHDFRVATAANRVIGAAGMERYPPHALLRSVVVDAGWRARGIAAALTDAVATHACHAGLTTLYLLTTRAEHYFARHGFSAVSRDALPPAIAASPQALRLCPRDAQAMKRAL